MALVFCDSFDHYATAALPLKWDDTTDANLGGTVGAVGRNGTSGISFTNIVQRSVIVPSADTYVLGFAIKRTAAAPGVGHQLCSFKEGTTIHVDLRWNADATLRLTRNGTTIGSNSSTVLALDVWYYVEVKVKVHDTAGTYEVKINGVQEIVDPGGTVDTRNAATGVITRIQIGNNNSNVAPTTDYDDVYIDSASFLGDVRVAALLPTGAGNSAQFTPSAGSNYQNVDEAAPNGDTDYNSSATDNDIDSFAMGNMPTNPSTIHGVQQLTYCRKDDAGAHTLSNLLRTASTNFLKTARSVLDTYTYLRDVWTVDPNTTAAWTQSNVDGLEAGYKRVS